MIPDSNRDRDHGDRFPTEAAYRKKLVPTAHTIGCFDRMASLTKVVSTASEKVSNAVRLLRDDLVVKIARRNEGMYSATDLTISGSRNPTR